MAGIYQMFDGEARFVRMIGQRRRIGTRQRPFVPILEVAKHLPLLKFFAGSKMNLKGTLMLKFQDKVAAGRFFLPAATLSQRISARLLKTQENHSIRILTLYLYHSVDIERTSCCFVRLALPAPVLAKGGSSIQRAKRVYCSAVR